MEGIATEAEAHRMASRAYDVSCDKLKCKTKKQDRQTDMYYGVFLNPQDGKYALVAHPDHVHDYTQEEKAKFRNFITADVDKYNIDLEVLLAIAGKTTLRGR